ncbi:MAG: glycosyltransferase [Deltaproteobacteria bacterium]|nr:glycosyltransferase [Deltaproteobacteria bacterium]
MRIWLLTSEMPHEVAGGIARYVENFARLLGGAGHEVVIIARTEQECDTILAPGVRLIGVVPRLGRLHEPQANPQSDAHPAYPYNVMAYWPAFSYQLADEVIRLLHQLPPPDIIESQEYAAIPYYLLQRKLTEQTPLARIPILVQLHSPTFELAAPNQEPRYRLPEYWVAQMEKFCIVAADALLAPSHFLTRRMQAAFPQSPPIATIPLPLLKTSEPPRENGIRGQIVYVGRLELRKGILPLVKACGRLWAEGVDFTLSLIGGDVDFPPRETTVGDFLQQRYARWISDGHLKILGQLPHAEVLRHMRQAWATVVPSLWENFPNTCMESMGEGQVVLASRAGGQAEMIEADGVNGFLFEWQTPGDFERQLRKVLALSETERLQVAHNAQRRIQALCAPEQVLPQRLAHYQSIIAQQQPRVSFPTVHAPRAEGEAHPTTVPPLSSDAGQAGMLSVVIPFYNLGPYLQETLTSILAAVRPPHEVIIVNDGSTDPASLALLSEIESKKGPEHVRVVHTENQGLASARNRGAEQARGEFLSFVDADDCVEEDFFAQAIALLQRYANVAFVYSWVRYFGEAQEIWPTWNAEFPYLLSHNMLAPLVVLRRAAFLQWGRNAPVLEYNLEDYEGWVGIVEAGGLGVSLAHPLVRYRVRAGSLSRSANTNQFLYLYDLITQRHPEAYRQWGVELFNLQNANGPGLTWNHPAQTVPGPSRTHVAALVQDRERLVAEVRTLSKAWEDHVRFIEAQRVYIVNLEKRYNESAALHGDALLPLLGDEHQISRRDYELGGRVVNRLRRTWLARQVSRSSRLKKVLRATLKKGRAFLSRGE